MENGRRYQHYPYKILVDRLSTMRTSLPGNLYVVGRMRKALIFMAIVTSFACLLLYWRLQPRDYSECIQQNDYSSNTLNMAKSRNGMFANSDSQPQWTWTCKDDRCERSLATDITAIQSLATCSMLCAKTQFWPQPTGDVSLSSTAIIVASSIFHLEVAKTPGPKVQQHLERAFELLKSDLRTYELGAPGPPLTPTVSAVIVRVYVNGTDDPRMTLKTNESYELKVRPTGGDLVVEIKSTSFCGARHGFETLTQLVWLDPNAGGGTLMMLQGASVTDSPKFSYRGFLLDTARNYFPVQDIIRTIDAMASVKLNTFHWHATDSQSFPLQLKKAPRLADFGAYSPELVYTPNDITTIVQHARLRGIRVIIEVDAPSHVGKAWSWGPEAGLGELALCVESEPWRLYCGEPPCGQLNPLNENVYDILESVYREIIDITQVDDIFHLGGDEVSENCWLRHFNETSPMQLWQKFTSKALERLKRANNGKLPEVTVLWSSGLTAVPFLESLDSDKITIQVWGASQWLESTSVIEHGYKTILSHVDAWYLDCGFGSWRDSGDGHCGPYKTWQKLWLHRPWTTLVKGVLGGEACQWSEQLDTAELDARVWPRTAAFAERMWSDPLYVDVGAGEYWRLSNWRTRAIMRGLKPAPLWPKWCDHNPIACL